MTEIYTPSNSNSDFNLENLTDEQVIALKRQVIAEADRRVEKRISQLVSNICAMLKELGDITDQPFYWDYDGEEIAIDVNDMAEILKNSL